MDIIWTHIQIIQTMYRLYSDQYSFTIQIRTLYLHFIWIICIWYSEYSQHYSQTTQIWLPDPIAAPCIDLVFFTGGGAAQASFSSAFLFRHSSFSLHLYSSTAPLVLSFFFLSSSFAPLTFWLSLAEKERERNVKASDAPYYNGSK